VFLRRVAAGAALIGAGGGVRAPAGEASSVAGQEGDRENRAYRVRTDAAKLARQRPPVSHPTNGDEARYDTKIGSYSKGLPHDVLGEVDRGAYQALTRALTTGRPADFEAIPLGLGRKLTNPQAGLAFDLEGPDSHHLSMRAAPSIASAEAAAELGELYWMALARDVYFGDYGSDAVIADAAADLSRFRDFRAPRQGERIGPDTIFRGATDGDLIGPYLSQFLWLDITMGAMSIPQRMRTAMPDIDYMTDYDDWLDVQNGFEPHGYALDPTPRYIRNLRDLGEWVHVDALYQAYHQACLILLGMGAPFGPGNPYVAAATQIGFGTFGGPHVLSLVTEVATRALKAVWYQKWLVHRRLRPEALAGLVHHTLSGRPRYPVHSEILHSDAVEAVASRHGSYLLPMAAPEGCPTHPAYGAGHATVAGACVTILKAWFDESFVLPAPVIPDRTGTSLLAYTGATLTVRNELNKLASNVAIGRNAMGFHYRSDCSESLKLGEDLAIGILEEQKSGYNEDATFTFTRFDGRVITI